MPSEYELSSLGSVANVRSGYAFKSGDMGDKGYPIIKIKNVVPPTVDITDCERVSETVMAEIPNVERYAIEQGDILIAMTGATVGKVGRFPATRERFYLNQRVGKVYLTAPRKAAYRYLYYVLSQDIYVRQMFGTADGSAQANISGAQIERLEIPLPPLIKQWAIAHILGTLDDKIELNRRMNETLEAMARALFKSWFVDFDPVRTKAEGRDPGIPKPLADLFPGRLVDSELGVIPEGWAVKPLRDLTDYLSRGIGPAYIETGGICVLNQKCIRDRRIDFAKARLHDEEKKPTDGRLLQRLDVLVNSTGVGTLGRAAQLWHVPEPAIVDSHVSVLRAAPGVDPWFFGVGLTGREEEIEALGEGSTGQTELSRLRLGNLACLAPPSEIQMQFGFAAERLLGRLSNAQQESETMGVLRDALLPKLISGELRVKDAARFVGVTV